MAVQDLKESPPSGQKTVLLFWAQWHEGSAGAMTQLLTALEGAAQDVRLARVEAESVPTLSKQYKVTMVPTFIMLDEAGTVVETLEGVEDSAEVTRAVMRLQTRTPASNTTAATANKEENAEEKRTEKELLTKRLDRLIGSSEVMLFMKGNPSASRCGFSRQAVELLEEEKIPFGSFDILSDEEVRQGLKKHSNWPTYPQLYAKGELVGGLDILKEMKEDGGTLREQLEITAVEEPPMPLNDRLKQLTNRSTVMLFMKGLPSAPRCGFSRQMVEILNEQKVSYDAFDILQDEQVRQGLKDYSDWPTYPQLYVSGDLVGGLDIVKEMKDDGSLSEVLAPATSS
mmetsp:Transcript_20529/g.44450  ORF Transcript_20529/g.44450 Transcript_20529/m.44450 type:complete len:342 (+) Transcript_20529:101-1126(+)